MHPCLDLGAAGTGCQGRLCPASPPPPPDGSRVPAEGLRGGQTNAGRWKAAARGRFWKPWSLCVPPLHAPWGPSTDRGNPQAPGHRCLPRGLWFLQQTRDLCGTTEHPRAGRDSCDWDKPCPGRCPCGEQPGPTGASVVQESGAPSRPALGYSPEGSGNAPTTTLSWVPPLIGHACARETRPVLGPRLSLCFSPFVPHSFISR